MSGALSAALKSLSLGRIPTESDLIAAFDALMEGQAHPAEIGAFLMGLSVLGETPEALVIGAKAMRARMNAVKAPEGAVDTCGTGGDAHGTYNISTAAALVAAGAGAVVAKHGNKAASSKSGSAEVLSELGINIFATQPTVEQALIEARVGFLFAPAHHSAVRHVGEARKAMGVRTIFNLLGPLSNPAHAPFQLLGVFDRRWLVPMAEALRALGSQRAWIVHGEDGLDELSTTGPSLICELHPDGRIEERVLMPESLGLVRAHMNDLKGGTPQDNAVALKALLRGETGAYRDIVLLNAAAALVVSGHCEDLHEGLVLATRSIDEGRAQNALNTLVRLTQADTRHSL
ncbi:anthranilate phosphoribosyltransferase [Woodsholea maritima]|uniref:anthranilate phosphoribosyltransferase n=1 Tax=Woodsholea maritima TaxID=240237 RepID=UPI00037E85AC|nr:anthranilate phosphoribosyltransferase [Woodsholea maritima]